MSSVSNSSSIYERPSPMYMHKFEGECVNPQLSRKEREELEKARQEDIMKAFNFLANADFTEGRKANNTFSCLLPCDNSVTNLISYVASHPLQILKHTFCCCLDKTSKYPIPLPETPARTLALTQEQFDRNTFGLFCLAPAIIVSFPFIPVLTIFFGILSGIAVTTFAGILTYVCSGDIGAIRNRIKTAIQGGIRVDAAQEIENAFRIIAEKLASEWKQALQDEDREKIKELIEACRNIRLKWDDIFEGMVAVGLTERIVRNSILAPISRVLVEILDDYEETVTDGVNNKEAIEIESFLKRKSDIKLKLGEVSLPSSSSKEEVRIKIE